MKWLKRLFSGSEEARNQPAPPQPRAEVSPDRFKETVESVLGPNASKTWEPMRNGSILDYYAGHPTSAPKDNDDDDEPIQERERSLLDRYTRRYPNSDRERGRDRDRGWEHER